MQNSILSLFRETPQMPVIVVTLTGSEEPPISRKIKGCQELLLRRPPVNDHVTGISFD